jgi:hypothetical protein
MEACTVIAVQTVARLRGEPHVMVICPTINVQNASGKVTERAENFHGKMRFVCLQVH